MASKLDEIEKAALNLPVAERAQLVTGLVASLGAPAPGVEPASDRPAWITSTLTTGNASCSTRLS